MSERLTAGELVDLDLGVRQWEDFGGSILEAITPFVAAILAARVAAERDALLAKFEALADEFHRTADACRNYADARAGLSDEANLRTAEAVNRNRAIELRAVIAEARA